MALWQWSRTAGTNATADSTINWAEGQSPSSVNDSARAMMARTADWRDDISGTITTGGTSTAYTVTSNQGFDTLAHLNGSMIAFVPHTTNGATVTLAVDGLTAKPLRSAPSVELGAGVLIQGTPYIATYNSSDGAYYLHSFYGSAFTVPLGAMLPFTGTTVPNSNFAFPVGTAISRTTFATYFAMVSTTYGVGDGVNTFNIPDMRGRIPVCQDNLGGSAASRVTTAGSSIDGTTPGASGGGQNVTLDITMIPSHNHTGSSVGNPTTHPNTINSPSNGSVPTNVNSVGVTGGAQVVGTATIVPTLVDHVHDLTIASQGGGSAHTNMPPAIIVPYILRVI